MYRRCSRSLQPLLLFLLVVWISVVTLRGVDAISTVISPGETFCVKEVLPPDSMMVFQFSILSGGERGVSVTLSDQKGTLVKHWMQEGNGVYETTEKDRDTTAFTLCFEKSVEHYSPANIGFFFRYHVDYTRVAKLSALDPIERAVQSIANEMRSVEVLQVRLRTQQKVHRHTVENTVERQLLWSVFQVIALISMSLIQLFLLKRFLERKTYV